MHQYFQLYVFSICPKDSPYAKETKEQSGEKNTMANKKYSASP